MKTCKDSIANWNDDRRLAWSVIFGWRLTGCQSQLGILIEIRTRGKCARGVLLRTIIRNQSFYKEDITL